MKVPVTVYLTPAVYRLLTAIAARHEVRVHALIEASVTRSLKRSVDASPRPPREPGDDIDRRIVELNAAGHTDSYIAKDVGLTQTTVSRRRRLMGLESPKPRRRR